VFTIIDKYSVDPSFPAQVDSILPCDALAAHCDPDTGKLLLHSCYILDRHGIIEIPDRKPDYPRLELGYYFPERTVTRLTEKMRNATGDSFFL
jgi:hypothetical protein